ncbi:hypothetical protein [Ruegeria atlantica]|uniref:hypothetical protein n=1 Tax=Ruegeria atlantica TaxID=81569 RepID=UPI0014808AFE|nr:hypothetical protein [Ruegeria atlantica]
MKLFIGFMTVAVAIRAACLCLVLAPAARAKSLIAEVICEPISRINDKLERQFGAERIATGVRGPEQFM